MHLDPTALNEWLQSGKAAIDIIKTAVGFLPKGDKRTEQATEAITRAEDALKLNEAAAAKAFGFPLCHCAMPPPIMLWHEGEKAYICPREGCGHRHTRGIKIPAGSLVAARTGNRSGRT